VFFLLFNTKYLFIIVGYFLVVLAVKSSRSFEADLARGLNKSNFQITLFTYRGEVNLGEEFLIPIDLGKNLHIYSAFGIPTYRCCRRIRMNRLQRVLFLGPYRTVLRYQRCNKESSQLYRKT
jgi:hypothetical protein